MAGLDDFIISHEQAHAFAKAICADIAEYVESHREEFELFLTREDNTKKELK